MVVASTSMAAPPLTSLTGTVLSAQLKAYYADASAASAKAAGASATAADKRADNVLNVAGMSYMTVAQSPSTAPAATVQLAAWRAVADAVTDNINVTATSKPLRANAAADVMSGAARTLVLEQARVALTPGGSGRLSGAQRNHVQDKMATVFAAIDRLAPTKGESHTAFATRAQEVAPLQYNDDAETVLTESLLKYATKLVVPYAHARFLIAYATPASGFGPGFYDQRVAQWLLLDALIRGVDALSTDAPAPAAGSPDATYVSAKKAALATLRDAMRNARDAEYALAGAGGKDSPLFKLYDGTAKASASARASTAALEPIQSAASARATRIASLQWNVAQAEAAARRARLVLVAWIVALFVALAVAVVLIVRASPAAVYAYAATVIVTVLALGVATVALRARAASRLDGAVMY